MLEVSDVSVAYGGVEALSHVSLTVDAGEFVTILGANGAGKTTLLRAITSLEEPATGSVRFEGRDITRLPAHKLAELGIATVPEGRQLFGHMSVRDNLTLGAFSRRRRQSSAQLQEAIERVLTAFPDLRDRLGTTAGSLSGGQQQMVAIGRALMSSPTLLVLDEPSLGLAPKMCSRIFNVISDLHAGGMSIILVEQNAMLSLQISQRGYVLDRGRVVLEGPSSSLVNDLAVQHAYLGGLDPSSQGDAEAGADTASQLADIQRVVSWTAKHTGRGEAA